MGVGELQLLPIGAQAGDGAQPPVMSTWPVGSSVVVCPAWTPTGELAVSAQVPVVGSYSSALTLEGVQPQPAGRVPATTRTWPVGSKVAVCSVRGVVMLPVGLHSPVCGSYTSALTNPNPGARQGLSPPR